MAPHIPPVVGACVAPLVAGAEGGDWSLSPASGMAPVPGGAPARVLVSERI